MKQTGSLDLPSALADWWFSTVDQKVVGQGGEVSPERVRAAQEFVAAWGVDAAQAGVLPVQILDADNGLLWQLMAEGESVLGVLIGGVVVTQGIRGLRAWRLSGIKHELLSKRIAARFITAVLERNAARRALPL